MGRALRFGIPVVLLLLLGWYASYATTILLWELRKLVPWLIAPALVALLAGAPALIRLTSLRRRGRKTGVVATGGVIALGWLGAIVGLGLGVFWLVYGEYLQDRAYVATMRVGADPVPDLTARAPYVVGEAQAAPNLGDVTGEIADVSYLPDTDRFAILVERRGWLAGYEVGLVQEVPLGGNSRQQQRCRFDVSAANARIGGWFTHNLGRKIANERRGVRFEADDAYVYCQGETPIVVVPLKRQTGFLVVTERPAGVALYDGHTGKVTVTDDTTKVPGPSYPISLAARQREGTAAVGSFADWWFERSGWDASEDGANEGNESEFSLRHRDDSGRSAYVTPLTPQGEASSVVAVSTVPTRHTGGGLAPLTVHRLNPTWSSPQAIVALIKAEYRDVCCWNDDQVFEVVPTGGSTWTATIGSEQAIRYRVEGRGQVNGREATCLKNADGTLVRCAYAAPGSPEEKELQQREQQKQQEQASSGGQQPGDLTKYTDEQLAELNRRLSEEINRRLKDR
ncbi:MAG TPA: sulfite exporter TauE/SafE family protein [Micromonospora sp.]